MNTTPSSNNFGYSSDDGLLDNVLTSIRAESVPKRPSESREPSRSSSTHSRTVSVAKKQNEKRQIAWPLLLSAAVMLIGATVFLWSSSVQPAYGEVQDAIRAARSIRYSSSLHQSDGSTSMQFCLDQGAAGDGLRSRISATGADGEESFEIMDLKEEVKLEVVHRERKAVVTELRPSIAMLIEADREMGRMMDSLFVFKELPEEAAEYVGKSKLNGRDVDEFKVRIDDRDYQLFADPDTDLPVRVESVKLDRDGSVKYREVYSDIEFNCEFDPDVFDATKIPDDYEVETIRFGDPPPESEVLVVSPEEGFNLLGFGSSIEEAIQVFGEPSINKSFGSTPVLHYNSRGMYLLFAKDGLRQIHCIGERYGLDIASFTGTTSKGIGIGSTADEVKAAYGESKPSGLLFIYRDGNVIEISVSPSRR